MGVVADVLDSIKLVAEGISHIRTIATAVNDGRDYLKSAHKQVREDLALLCAELQKTTQAVASASGLLTHFRFTISGSAKDSEPARFNEHLIKHKERAALVGNSLQSMRGHCHVIRGHAERLQSRAAGMGLNRLLLVFGIDSAARDMEVAEALNEIYNDEMQGYVLVSKLSEALQRSLEDVANALGKKGSMSPENVESAAEILGKYAEAFGRLESECNYLALDIQQSIDALMEV